MRLIDADELIKRLEQDEDIGKDHKILIEAYVDMEKTAYDLDKVMKELSLATNWTQPTYDDAGFSNDDAEEIFNAQDVFVIVQSGGLERNEE